MNKTIFAIIAVAVIALGGYFLLKNPKTPAPSSNFSSPPTPQETPNQTPPSPTTTLTPVTQETPSSEQNVVTYTNTGYLPNTLRVKVGTTVTFRNESSRSMWTASAVHPTHKAYPSTGGCLGSTFDACKGVQSGTSWSFKFDIAGTWKYHNHLNPSDTGTIIVEK